MHALFLVHVIYMCCRSLVQSYVLQRPSFMGLAEPDEQVLYGSERCLQLMVPDLLPRRRVQVPQWPPQVPLLLMISSPLLGYIIRGFSR